MSKKLAVVVVCGLVLFLASRPLFYSTLFFVHDYLHTARIAEAARGLEAGHLPVRWSQAFNFGYGMPLFSFYAPLPSLLGAVLVLMGIPLIFSFKVVYLAVSLVTVVGAYLLGRLVYNRTGGLLVAMLFTLAPYRAVNLFVRGALSETWGMAFYPWILLGIVMILNKKQWGVFCLALAVAGLALSHNLSFMIFLPLAGVWGVALLLFWPMVSHQPQKIKLFDAAYVRHVFSRLGSMAGGVWLGMGMASFYLLPAYVEKNSVQVEKMTTSYYFNFHLHFLYLRQFVTNYWGYGGSAWGPDDGISFFLGFGILFALLCGLMYMSIFLAGTIIKMFLLSENSLEAAVTSHQNMWTGILISLLSGGLGIVAVLMTTEKSVFIWDHLSLLRFVQFPWRFVSAASLFLAISASVVSLLPSKKMRFILTTTILCLCVFGAWRYFQPESYLEHDDALYYGDTERITQNLSSVLVDYVPSDLPLDPQPAYSLLTSASTDWEAEEIVTRPHEKVIKTVTQQPQNLPLNLAWYPGWRAYIDGQPTDIHKSNDLITIPIPAGEHVVTVLLTETPVRKLSNAISVLSISFLFGYCLYKEKSFVWMKKKS